MSHQVRRSISTLLACIMCALILASVTMTTAKANPKASHRTGPATHPASHQWQHTAPRPPNDHEKTMLVLSTVASVNQANLSGNYTVLYQLAAPEFQRRNPPVKLARIFAGQRKARIDLAPALLFAPEFAPNTRQLAQDYIQLNGTLATRPLQINFDFAYKWSANRWKLISVALNPVANRTLQVPQRRAARSWTHKLSHLFRDD